MKRLNPDTDKPFVRGDTRADGFLFAQYNLTKLLKSGFFQEVWLNPDVFNKQCDRQKLTYSGRANKLFHSAKARCARRKAGVVTINRDWIEKRIEKGFCELTHLPFDLSASMQTTCNLYAPSLDRIDSSNPDYSPENSRLVLHGVNVALNEFGLDDMLPIFERLIQSQVRTEDD